MEMRGLCFPCSEFFHSNFNDLGTAQRGREIPHKPPFGEIGKLGAYHGRSSHERTTIFLPSKMA